MPMEGRGLYSKGLTEDTLSVLRDGGNNGNEISKNSWDIGNIKTSYIYISVPLDKWRYHYGIIETLKSKFVRNRNFEVYIEVKVYE